MKGTDVETIVNPKKIWNKKAINGSGSSNNFCLSSQLDSRYRQQPHINICKCQQISFYCEKMIFIVYTLLVSRLSRQGKEMWDCEKNDMQKQLIFHAEAFWSRQGKASKLQRQTYEIARISKKLKQFLTKVFFKWYEANDTSKSWNEGCLLKSHKNICNVR